MQQPYKDPITTPERINVYELNLVRANFTTALGSNYLQIKLTLLPLLVD